jgi:hypothetical protein
LTFPQWYPSNAYTHNIPFSTKTQGNIMNKSQACTIVDNKSKNEEHAID